MTWAELRHFHKQPGVIAAWCTLFGPMLRWLTPPRRRFLLALAALVIVVKHPVAKLLRMQRQLQVEATPTGQVLLALVLFGFVCLCYLAAKRFAALPAFVRRHPQVCLHSIFWLILTVLWFCSPQNSVARTVLMGCVFALPFLLWRIGYMLFTAQRGKMASTGFRDHLFYIYPIWGGSDTPYGKGLDYLSGNEARDEQALARSQLSGLKLFLLAGLWTIALGILEGVLCLGDNVYRRAFGGFSLGIPQLQELFATPAAYPVWLSWIALYLELIGEVLELAIRGHIIIGLLRLFGFNVFRNTYKPLLAESVVEFWNRYYYYFKELLVNFFFFPTFTRYFKGWPRLRIFAAVFAAAFFGNVYYHGLHLADELATANFSGLWAVLQSRVFYCVLLGSGIWISMLREQRRTRGKTVRTGFRRGLAIFGVWTFFSVIHIWSERDPASFFARTHFFIGLFGLR